MADNTISLLQDCMGQFRNKVVELFRMCYDPTHYTWKTLDGNLRFVFEYLGDILTLDLLGEEDGRNRLIRKTDPNTAEETMQFGKAILEKTKDVFQEKGISANILTGITDGISKHNVNSHGGAVTDREREEKGKTNVLASLPLLARFLTTDIQIPEISADVKQLFANCGRFLEDAEKLVKRDIRSSENNKIVKGALDRLFPGQTSFPNTADYNYILILPEQPDAEFAARLRALMIGWTIVVDQEHEGNAVFDSCLDVIGSRLNNTALTRRLSQEDVNWFFINGRKSATLPKERKALRNTLKENLLKLKNIIVINFCDDNQKAKEALETIWEFFVSSNERQPDDKTKVFSVIDKSGTPGALEHLIAADGYGAKVSEIDLSADDFLQSVIESKMFPAPKIVDDACVWNASVYESVGIKFLTTETEGSAKSIWDNFYSGRQLTIRDLENNRDVNPRGIPQETIRFQNRLKEALTDPETRIFHLKHQPGAGGTSLIRRIAFNLWRECSNPKVLPVFISKYDAISTLDRLDDLSHSIGDKTNLLIVVDDKEITGTDFTKIRSGIRKKGIHAIIVLVEHSLATDENSSSADTFILNSRIADQGELDRFDDKFSTAFSAHLPAATISETLEDIKSLNGNDGKDVEMIYYPYGFSEQINNRKEGARLESPDRYVALWMEAVTAAELKRLCAYVAFVNKFTASKALDIYTVASVWQNEKHDTLDDYEAKDIEAVDHLLRVSFEETADADRSTLKVPRYAAFADKILRSFNPAWEDNLSQLALDFIDSLPDKLLPEEERLMMDLFILQSRLSSYTGTSNPDLAGRLSPLMGRIVKGEEGITGAINIFAALIRRYPDNRFYKIHYGRLLFEVAHDDKATPDDKNFTVARRLIEEVLSEEDQNDEFHHIAGMLWRRMARAYQRSVFRRETTAEEKQEAMDDIIAATDKAIEYFTRCNELNGGTSIYGFVSTAELLIDTIEAIRKLTPSEQQADVMEQEPLLNYLDLLDGAIANLSGPQFEASQSSGLEKLQSKYLGLIGKTTEALSRARSRYDSVTETDEKSIYGHRIMSLLKGVTRSSKAQFYGNMDKESRSLLHAVTKDLSLLGDLRAAEEHFLLCRYTNHDELGSGQTYQSLMQWNSLAEQAGDDGHILRSTFYRYVAAALRILNNGERREKNLETEYEKLQRICRDLILKLDDSKFFPIAFAGNRNISTWNSVLDPSDAYDGADDQGRRRFSNLCRRVDACITRIDGRQGEAEIDNLTELTFTARGIRSNSLGRKLRNAVLGFRYIGAGLFGFEVDADMSTDYESRTGAYTGSRMMRQPKPAAETSAATPVAAKTPHIPTPQLSEKKKAKPAEPEIFKAPSERDTQIGVKQVGYLDLSKFENKRKRR